MPDTLPISRVNDFVVRFANTNGSGSASDNELFARAVLRMGVPVAARNIFPSNIQGMPTWYELRVSEQGWLGRRGGCERREQPVNVGVRVGRRKRNAQARGACRDGRRPDGRDQAAVLLERPAGR